MPPDPGPIRRPKTWGIGPWSLLTLPILAALIWVAATGYPLARLLGALSVVVAGHTGFLYLVGIWLPQYFLALSAPCAPFNPLGLLLLLLAAHCVPRRLDRLALSTVILLALLLPAAQAHLMHIAAGVLRPGIFSRWSQVLAISALTSDILAAAALLWLTRSRLIAFVYIAICVVSTAGELFSDAIDVRMPYTMNIAPSGTLVPVDTLAYAMYAALLITWVRIERSRAERLLGCPSCGYDTTALSDRTCPECGAELTS